MSHSNWGFALDEDAKDFEFRKISSTKTKSLFMTQYIPKFKVNSIFKSLMSQRSIFDDNEFI